jgi:glutathione synthase
MKLLFLADPLAGLKPRKDTTIAMMRAAARRGHEVCAAPCAALSVRAGVVHVVCDRLEVRDGDDWYATTDRAHVPLADFDAVLMRKDPPVDTDYLLATQLLDIAARAGTRLFNAPRALRDCNEKLAILDFPDLIAPTCVSASRFEIDAFLAAEQDIIVKPLTEMGGAGIFRLTASDPNRSVIVETLTRGGQRPIMAQRYLPAIAEGDKRILLIDGDVVPWALARIPRAGETRGNLAAGGIAHAQALTERDREIARRVATWARERGILLAGLDVIGEHLTEINITSPTGFQEITAQTGWDVAERFVAALERVCGAPQAA